MNDFSIHLLLLLASDYHIPMDVAGCTRLKGAAGRRLRLGDLCI